MASTTFVGAKAYLNQDFKGTHLYNHLTEVILKLVNDRPGDALSVLEDVSRAVRDSTFSAGSGEGTATKGRQHEANVAATATWAANCTALLASDPSSGYDKISSSMVDGLEWAGIALDSAEVVLINQALSEIAATSKAKSVRFFGKILGTKADYYVVQVESASAAAPTAQVEGREGTNRYSYYVAPSPEAAFVLLPPVQAALIVASTTRKRYLTGNLDAAVLGHPPFKGTEKDLLAATIARINGDTNLSISGYFEKDEETGEMKVAEEFEAADSGEAQAEAGGWVAKTPAVNEVDGRVVPFQTDPEEEPEVPEDLREIDEEKWACYEVNKVYGVAKSKTWPGATSVSDGRGFISVYIGYGIKAAGKRRFSPQAPPTLPAEYGAGEEEEPVPPEADDTIVEPEKPEEEGDDADADDE